jgi:hypothetical protein
MKSGFLPSFEDFSVWDDILRPFFLSLSAYLVSFGPLAAMMIVMVFFVMGAMKDGVIPGKLGQATGAPVASELPNAAKAAEQSEKIRSLLNRQAAVQSERAKNAADSASAGAPSAEALKKIDDEQAALNEQFRQMTEDARARQAMPGAAQTPDSPSSESAMIQSFVRRGFKYVLLTGIFLLWGFIYFPAACIVAGYTNSIGATINPLVGLDTMWNLGLDYIRLLLMTAGLVILGGAIAIVVAIVLSPFNLPYLGNLPAKFVTSFIGFYLWAVFACTIGFLLFKSRSKLKLPS